MDFLVTPWRHQVEGFNRATKQRDFAFFFEMGTGKTLTTIQTLRWHYARKHRIMRTLILCPLITVHNWKREIHAFSKIKNPDAIVLSGPGKKRVKMFQEAALHKKDLTLTEPRIFITNYEAVEMEDLFKLIQVWRPEILVCDESHRCKNPESKRARAVVRIADKADHRYILTGTPILNTAMDIYNQYRILDSGSTFSLPDPEFGRRPMNFYEFRGIYFEDMNKGMPTQKHFPKWIPRGDTYEDLNRMIYHKAMRVLAKDCLDLPELIRSRVDVELGAEQKRLYEEMKREFITFIQSHEASGEPRAVVAQMAITKALRLQQIVSGYVKTEDGVEVAIKDNPRIEALKEILEDLTPNHKVIVWAVFKQNYREIAALCQKLKIDYTEIHGDISSADKNKNELRYRNDASCRVMIANQQAGGIGINLVENKNIVKDGQRSYSVFFSKNFSYADDLQAERRNWRGGSEVYAGVTRIDLVAKGTIDELVLQALADKQNIAEQVLEWKDRI